MWNVHTLDHDREREGRKGGKEEVKHIRRMHLGLEGSSSLAAGLRVEGPGCSLKNHAAVLVELKCYHSDFTGGTYC